MKTFAFVPWDAIPQQEWNNRVEHLNAPAWYHDLNFLHELMPEGGMLSYHDGLAFIPWPVTRKFGIIKTVQQPLWVQRFNLLCANNEDIIKVNVNELLKQSLLVNLSLSGEFATEGAQLMNNRILTPSESGHFLRMYNSQTKRNLKSADKLDPIFQSCEVGTGVHQYFQLVGQKLGLDVNKHWKKLEKAIHQSTEIKLLAFQLVAKGGREPLANLVVLQDRNRIYNLLPSTTALGKSVMAMTTLIHRVLNHFDGQGFIFDFEGSMNPGIDRFYSSFGATLENYTRFSRKNLF